MKSAIPFFAALLFSGHLTAAGCSVPDTLTGQDYHAARVTLIRSGWYPVLHPAWLTRAPAGMDAAHRGPALWGYLEMLECAGTGSAPCLWRWMAPAGAIVDVRTAGEDYRVTGSRCVHESR